jgi:hypothetical protein
MDRFHKLTAFITVIEPGGFSLARAGFTIRNLE